MTTPDSAGLVERLRAAARHHARGDFIPASVLLFQAAAAIAQRDARVRELEAREQTMLDAMVTLAAGRKDCGRPYAGEFARGLARKLLVGLRIDWNYHHATLVPQPPAESQAGAG